MRLAARAGVAVVAALALGSVGRAADWGRVDEAVRAFVAENRVPGAAVAIARDGEVVYERGFGEAKAGSRFRVASLSKPVTAVAVLRLVERGQVGLDDPVMKYVGGEVKDERWRAVTVRHLLTHTGGFDRAASFDPMFRCMSLGMTRPAEVVEYMRGRSLDFAPGEKYAYSNFGYCLLGRVIEKASGRGYEEYVRAEVLRPLGAEGMRVGEAAGEVEYHVSGKPFRVGIMDAHGGWVASVGEMVRFAAGVERVLSKASVKELWARPALKGAATGAVYYGLGWQVRELGGGRINTWHTGLLDGASSIMVRRWDGLAWVVLMNADVGPDGKRDLWGKADGMMHRAVDRALGK